MPEEKSPSEDCKLLKFNTIKSMAEENAGKILSAVSGFFTGCKRKRSEKILRMEYLWQYGHSVSYPSSSEAVFWIGFLHYCSRAQYFCIG
jgi:hypothetical protein